MRKGSAQLVIIMVVALVTIGGLVYYALAGSKKTNEVSENSPQSTVSASVTLPTPTPNPNKTITAGEFTFDLPSSWVEENAPTDQITKKYQYGDAATGNYIRLSSTTGGGGRGSDAFWNYRFDGVAPKTLAFVNEDPDCNPQGMCQKGDGQTTIGILISGISVETGYKGRFLYIEFGNTKSESADRQVYRDIMKTMKLN